MSYLLICTCSVRKNIIFLLIEEYFFRFLKKEGEPPNFEKKFKNYQFNDVKNLQKGSLLKTTFGTLEVTDILQQSKDLYNC